MSDGKAAYEVCTSSCQAGIEGSGAGQFTTPTWIAVDNSSGPSAGDVYVADTSDDVVQKFDSSGSLITSWETNGGKVYKEGIVGIAVSPTGALVVAPGYNGNGIALDSFGNIQSGGTGIAIDTAANNTYYDYGTEIAEYAEACNPYKPCEGSAFGEGHLSSATGLAFDPQTGFIYAANSGEDNIAVFAPLSLPEVSIEPVVSPGVTSATLTGHVDPHGGGDVTDCNFEYVSGPFTNEIQTVEISGASGGTFTLSFEGHTTEPIPAFVAGYPGVAGYIQPALEALPSVGPRNVRVFGSEGGGPILVEFVGPFTDTNVPQLTADSSDLTPSGATLAVATETEGHGWSTAAAAPCTPGAPLSAPANVSASLTGLTPFTTYYYRLVASGANDFGFDSYSRIRSFTPMPSNAPSVDATTFSDVTPTTVTLGAEINPNSTPTIYRFQYGTEENYGSQTLPSESIGADASLTLSAAKSPNSSLTRPTTFASSQSTSMASPRDPMRRS